MFTTPSGTALFAFFFRGAARCSTALAILLSLGDRDREKKTTLLCLCLSTLSLFLSFHLVLSLSLLCYLGVGAVFLPATVRRGPLRVRALVRVRCPRTGRLRRWRKPR